MSHSLPQWTEELRDGSRVVIRPIVPSDAPGMAAFIRGLSEQSRHLLFLCGVAYVRPADLERICNADGVRDMAFVALPPGGALTEPVGFCRYAATDPAAGAEIAAAVADAWQGKGLGTRLVQRLIDHARDHGICRLFSIDTGGNLGMRRLARRLGFTERTDPDDPRQVIYSLELTGDRGAPAGRG